VDLQSPPMQILLTNDDGIHAPGILAMYRKLAERADVRVVAPLTVQSGGSHAITIRHPVLWHEMRLEGDVFGTAVEGTPADCVKLALHALCDPHPDLVVSGINSGLNTGIHVLYSGTVSAAMEAAIKGVPAVAVSLELAKEMDYDRAATIADEIIQKTVSAGLPAGNVCNINIPELVGDRPRGVRLAPMSSKDMAERIERREDPIGRPYYWLGGDFKNIGDQTDTDRHAVAEGYVSVTPLQIDMTDNHLLESWSQSIKTD